LPKKQDVPAAPLSQDAYIRAARRPAQQMSFAKAAVQTLPVPKTFSNFSFSPQAQKRDSKQVFLAGSALFYAR
jgi:hypothetical protein